MRTPEEYAEIKTKLSNILDSFDGNDLIYQLQDFLKSLDI